MTGTPVHRPVHRVAAGVGPARVALLPLIVVAVSTGLAVLVGVATYAVLDATGDEEGLGELTYVVAAIAVAILAMVVLTVVGLILVARRLFLPGHQMAPVLVSGAVLFLVFAVGSSVTWLIQDLPLTLSAFLAPATVLTPSIVFLWWRQR